MNSYVSGTLVTSTAVFTNRAGVITDPSTITLKYRIGNGAVQTAVYPAAPIVKDQAGTYHADFDTSGWAQPSDLVYITQWTGTGNVQAIQADVWRVTAPQL